MSGVVCKALSWQFSFPPPFFGSKCSPSRNQTAVGELWRGVARRNLGAAREAAIGGEIAAGERETSWREGKKSWRSKRRGKTTENKQNKHPLWSSEGFCTAERLCGCEGRVTGARRRHRSPNGAGQPAACPQGHGLSFSAPYGPGKAGGVSQLCSAAAAPLPVTNTELKHLPKVV